MSDEDVFGSAAEEIVSATIWCPVRGWGPFYDDDGPYGPINAPRQQGFGHFDRIAQRVKDEQVES